MKFKKIQTKMLAAILPVILLAFLLLTVVAAASSRGLANRQIRETMEAARDKNLATIDSDLDEVRTTAESLSVVVANSYKQLSLADYEQMIAQMVGQHPMVNGSGIWFEPYVYDSSQQYVGPYIYRDGDKMTTTYDYSNADYDYFNQEYYLLAKNNKDGHAVITDPYWDETSQSIMSTCTMPISDNGQFLGCVTVDITLDKMSEIVSEIKVGEDGTGFLIRADGVYIAGVDQDKVSSMSSILDEGGDLAAAGQKMLDNESGEEICHDGGTQYKIFFGTLKGTGWKLAIRIPTAEINRPVLSMIRQLVIIALIALIASTIIIILQVRSIAKLIQTVNVFAGSLAEGNFTVQPLHVKSSDELGKMSKSLNDMFDSNRGMIGNISNHSEEIASSSQKLNESAATLLNEFSEIQASMDKINEAMLATSAATEQVNASAEEVGASVTVLASETEQSLQLSDEIQKRATEVEHRAKASSESATKLVKNFEVELEASVANAQVVENIDQLANVIAGIAEQINLLSLNASIEAARAGEHGKGFAVVASEIGKLANDTSQAVGDIQSTIGQVQSAFEQLSRSAKEMLSFVSDTVAPDYDQFVEVASQYGKDAQFFAEISNKVSGMSNNIQLIMNEVTEAIQSIAESSVDTTNISGDIVESVHGAAGTINEVSDMSQEQNRIAEDLDTVVHQFRL